MQGIHTCTYIHTHTHTHTATCTQHGGPQTSRSIIIHHHVTHIHIHADMLTSLPSYTLMHARHAHAISYKLASTRTWKAHIYTSTSIQRNHAYLYICTQPQAHIMQVHKQAKQVENTLPSHHTHTHADRFTHMQSQTHTHTHTICRHIHDGTHTQAHTAHIGHFIKRM